MADMNKYLENALLDAAMRGNSYAIPGNVYVGLTTTVPTDTVLGNTVTELSGNNYSRQQAVFANAAASGSIATTAAVTFSATGNAWPTVLGMILVDASTGGNVLFQKSISPFILSAGSNITLGTGNITVSLD